ncbi:uncharacterized protein J8A68_000486 [[Candida] subhashii]|uniref:Thioredoxin domain-containing protein n=1 Tax=[Candida] subhashii TaxID=561895 RepID=A0A8J5QT29_9ASCO|nr:uncharacterized protein J8A68_000486 [[Candida] subhashii]KAG7666056.1 hypothetical protein J8A68_000486 [[Candida] subhashii]
MNTTLLFLLQFLLILVQSSNTDSINDHLIELKDSSIQETLEKADFSFIYFYSDNCQYCHKFNPTFENLSVLYNNLTNDDNEHKRFQVLKVDARRNPRLRELFKINSFPTLKLLQYETKEIFTYEYGRDLNTLMEYFRQNVHVEPNNANYKSKVSVFQNSTISDFIKNNKNDRLIVFTMSYISDWEDYNYPVHFYQQLASSNKDVEFAICDMELSTDVTDIIADYEISNYPSMIYFDKKGRFKLFHTNSQNHIVNDVLNLSHIEQFINNINNDDITGKWFTSTQELHEYNQQHLDYEGHKFQKIGFNQRQSNNNNNDKLSEEQEYELLLQDLEL